MTAMFVCRGNPSVLAALRTPTEGEPFHQLTKCSAIAEYEALYKRCNDL